MDKGRIAATGSHDELMRECGLYNNMFTLQAEWYVDMPADTASKAFARIG
jgi:ATP-binding cassette subfamily B protein